MPESHYDFFSCWSNEIPNKPKSKPKPRSESAPQQSSQSMLNQRAGPVSSVGSECSSAPKTPSISSAVDLPQGVKAIGTCPAGGDLIRFMHARGLWPGKNGVQTSAQTKRIQENLAKWKRAGRIPVYKGVPADELINKGLKVVWQSDAMGLKYIENSSKERPEVLDDKTNGKRRNEHEGQASPRKIRKH